MGKMVEFPTNGKTGSGYLATPQSGGGPGVIVIQEWWGLVDHIKDLAERFAQAGFVALAPDMYPGETTTRPHAARQLLAGQRACTGPLRPDNGERALTAAHRKTGAFRHANSSRQRQDNTRNHIDAHIQRPRF